MKISTRRASLIIILIVLAFIPTFAAETPDSYGNTQVVLIGGPGVGLTWGCYGAGSDATFTYQGEDTWKLNGFVLQEPTGGADWENVMYIGSLSSAGETQYKVVSDGVFKSGETLTFNKAYTGSGADIVVKAEDAGTYDVTLVFTSATSGTIRFDPASATPPDPPTPSDAATAYYVLDGVATQIPLNGGTINIPSGNTLKSIYFRVDQTENGSTTSAYYSSSSSWDVATSLTKTSWVPTAISLPASPNTYTVTYGSFADLQSSVTVSIVNQTTPVPDVPGGSGNLSATLPVSLKAYGINGGSYIPDEDLTMWYTTNEGSATPGEGYKVVGNSLLIGNGALGGMLEINNATHKLYISEKELFTATATAHNLQSFGALTMTPGYGKEATNNIIQQLDLTNGVYSFIGKRADNIVESMEWFASYPDQVMVCNITASETNKLDYGFYLNAYNTLGASVSVSLQSGYAEAKFSGAMSGSILSYALNMRVVPVGGTITVSGGNINVTNADGIYVYISGLTDYDSSEPTLLSGTATLADKVAEYVDAAATKGWMELYNTHTADHSGLFGRMNLNLSGQKNDVSTQRLLLDYAAADSGRKRMLENLVFALGRYMEIASSRPRVAGKGVDCPSNLQGIWNEGYAQWMGDIHGNINVNMNYWPAEITNLSETHLGLCNWVMNLSKYPLWQNRAQAYSKGGSWEQITDGWTCYMASSPFGGGYNYQTDKNNAVQAWYCHHLIQHYLYTQDQAYLQQMMPVLWDAARFWIQYLIKKSEGASYIYETQAEDSPEQGATGDGTPHTQQLVYYLFENLVKLTEKYGKPSGATDAEWEKIQDVWQHLDNGLHTYMQDGQPCLREDKQSNSRFGEKNHRHLSHLMCVYPLATLHPDDPLFEAAQNTMVDRGAVGYGSTDLAVWTIGWKSCNWAQARDHRAFENFAYAFTKAEGNNGGLYNNLYSNNQTTQIDGNFGLTAAVAEMLLQSNRSDVLGESPYAYIDIAPALPIAEWPAGEVAGLKAQGNFEVSYIWSGGKVTEIRVKAVAPMPVPLYVHYDTLTDDAYHVSEISGMSRDTSVPSDKWDADHVWKFVPSASGSYVVITIGQGEIVPNDVRADIVYSPAPQPNREGIKTVMDGSTPLLNVMFGTTDVKYFIGEYFTPGGVKWTVTSPDADLTGDPADFTGYVSASAYSDGLSALPFTEANGQMAGSYTEGGGMFLTPVSGHFLRFEPRFTGLLTLWLRQSAPLYIIDESGAVLTATTSIGATRQSSVDGSANGAYVVPVADTKVKYTIDLKGGKTYYVATRDANIGFVALAFDKAAYTSQTYTINTLGTVSAQSWPEIHETANITLQRAFTAGYCHPIVLPFSVSESQMREIFGDDVVVLYLDPYAHSSAGDEYRSVYAPAVDNGRLAFTVHHYQMLYANVPAFIIPSQSIENPVFTQVTYEGSAVDAYALDSGGYYWVRGAYTSTSAADAGNIYYIDNIPGTPPMPCIYHASEGVAMKPTCVWIEASQSPHAPQLMTVAARTFGDDDVAASLSTVIADQRGVSDGADGTYNLIGMPVDATHPLSPGIYITRGRKLIIR